MLDVTKPCAEYEPVDHRVFQRALEIIGQFCPWSSMLTLGHGKAWLVLLVL